MSDYPMLISNKLHSFRNFQMQRYEANVKYDYDLNRLPSQILFLFDLKRDILVRILIYAHLSCLNTFSF